MLFLTWNEGRILQLTTAQTPHPKQAITDFLNAHDGESLGPYPDVAIFFREHSLLYNCKEQMKVALPWAFCVGASTAAILGVGAGIPIATSIVVSKTERVRPDIGDFAFFGKLVIISI